MTTSTFFKVQDGKSATVCLNGHTLTMSNSFDVAGTLTIEDCGSTGSVRFNSKKGFRDYGIGLASGSTFNLTSGTLIGVGGTGGATGKQQIIEFNDQMGGTATCNITGGTLINETADEKPLTGADFYNMGYGTVINCGWTQSDKYSDGKISGSSSFNGTAIININGGNIAKGYVASFFPINASGYTGTPFAFYMPDSETMETGKSTGKVVATNVGTNASGDPYVVWHDDCFENFAGYLEGTNIVIYGMYKYNIVPDNCSLDGSVENNGTLAGRCVDGKEPLKDVYLVANDGYVMPAAVSLSSGTSNGTYNTELLYERLTPTTARIYGSMNKTNQSIIISAIKLLNVRINLENATPISGEVNQTITPGDPMTEVQLSAYEGYYFPDTFTQDGITFTNNGDGTATVSGTPTKSVMINASAKLPTHKHGTTEFDTVLTSEMIMNFASMGDSSTKSVPTGNYYLLSDIAPDCILVVESGATVNICLNGFTMSKVKIIVAGGTLGIYDCSEASTGSITGMDMGNVISVNAGTLNLYSGKISGNGASSDWDPEKAALYVNGTFNMYGGTVSSKKYNSFDEYAVAIYVTNNINLENGRNFGGTFNISGGTVTERVVIIRAYYKDETTEITHDPNPIDASGYTASAPIDLWLENPIAGVVAVNNGNVSDWHILNNGFRLEKEGDNLVVKGSPKYKVTINLSEGYEIDPSLGLGVEVLEQYVAKGEEITKVVLKVKTGYYKTDTTIVTTFNGVTVYHYDSQSVLVYGSTTEDIQIDISNVSAVPVADAHAHDGMYFATDLNANFAANQNAYGNDTDSFFTKKVIVYGTTECDKNTGAAITTVDRPSEEVTGLALYRESTVKPYSTNEGRFYEISSDYHYEISGGTYYLSEDLDIPEAY